MRLTIPGVTVRGGAQSTPSGSPRGRVRLLSLNRGSGSAARAPDSRTLQTTCLAAAAAVDPGAVQQALDNLCSDRQAFFANAEYDESTVRHALRHVLAVMRGNTPAATVDLYTQQASANIGVPAAALASGIHYLEAMSDNDCAAAVTSLANYAVSYVPAEVADQLIMDAYNRSRTDVLSGQPTPSTSLTEQVQTNTEQIRQLMEQANKAQPARSKTKSGG